MTNNQNCGLTGGKNRLECRPSSRAGIAQLVERNLAKVEVASSNLVSRSSSLRLDSHIRVVAINPGPSGVFCMIFRCGQVVEWLYNGLQSRVHRFDSGPGLHIAARSPGGGIGRRNGLKIRRSYDHAGSIPAPGTNLSKLTNRLPW